MGDHRHDRFKVPAPQNLHPSTLDEHAQARDVFRMLIDEPFQQRPRGMQRKRDFGIAFKDVEERQVTIAVRGLEYAVEVSHGLMVVQARGSRRFDID